MAERGLLKDRCPCQSAGGADPLGWRNRFFKRLIKGAVRKVFLILGNLNAHHARKVNAGLADHKEQIEVFDLPSYSPQLNPDECLNADRKDGVTPKAAARNTSRLNKAAMSHLRKRQNSPQRVRKYFEHQTVRHAT